MTTRPLLQIFFQVQTTIDASPLLFSFFNSRQWLSFHLTLISLQFQTITNTSFHSDILGNEVNTDLLRSNLSSSPDNQRRFCFALIYWRTKWTQICFALIVLQKSNRLGSSFALNFPQLWTTTKFPLHFALIFLQLQIMIDNLASLWYSWERS